MNSLDGSSIKNEYLYGHPMYSNTLDYPGPMGSYETMGGGIDSAGANRWPLNSQHHHHQDVAEEVKSCDLILQNRSLWEKFNELGTEMIITKSGRRMFPSMRLKASGLDPDVRYCIFLEITLVSNTRLKFTGRRWTPGGLAEPQSASRLYMHPDSPAPGAHWMEQLIVFNKVKLTNNSQDRNGHIVLTSMHRYQPKIHIVRTSNSRHFGFSPTFIFPETKFIAVTAYQNDKITKLKIDHNPFAKGFRDCGQSKSKRKAPQTSTPIAPSAPPLRRRTISDSCSTSVCSMEDSRASTSGAETPDLLTNQSVESRLSADDSISNNSSTPISDYTYTHNKFHPHSSYPGNSSLEQSYLPYYPSSVLPYPHLNYSHLPYMSNMFVPLPFMHLNPASNYSLYNGGENHIPEDLSYKSNNTKSKKDFSIRSIIGSDS